MLKYTRELGDSITWGIQLALKEKEQKEVGIMWHDITIDTTKAGSLRVVILDDQRTLGETMHYI